MHLHLPFFSWDSFQYAFAAFKIIGTIYFMQLQFCRFSVDFAYCRDQNDSGSGKCFQELISKITDFIAGWALSGINHCFQ